MPFLQKQTNQSNILHHDTKPLVWLYLPFHHFFYSFSHGSRPVVVVGWENPYCCCCCLCVSVVWLLLLDSISFLLLLLVLLLMMRIITKTMLLSLLVEYRIVRQFPLTNTSFSIGWLFFFLFLLFLLLLFFLFLFGLLHGYMPWFYNGGRRGCG